MNNNKLLILLFTICISFSHLANLAAQTAVAQEKKTLDHEDFAIWNTIQQTQISNDGNWVVYMLRPHEGDPIIKVYDAKTGKTHSFDRASKPTISSDNQYVIFEISPAQDSIKALKRQKVKKKDMPKDSIGIFSLLSQNLTKVGDIKSFKMPKKWSGWLAYQKEVALPMEQPDTTFSESKIVRAKKKKKKTEVQLIMRELVTGKEDSISRVQQYVHAEEGAKFIYYTNGNKKETQQGVYIYDCEQKMAKPLLRSTGTFKKLSLSRDGQQAAFVADLDTTDARIRPFALYHWTGRDTAKIVASNEQAWMPKNQLISEHAKLEFSKDGSRLFFGVAPEPILEDTTLLPEEVVNVEVWNYLDNKLYTQQEVQTKRDKTRSYRAVLDVASKRVQVLGSEALPHIQTGNEGNANIVLAYDDTPYLRQMMWEGGPSHKDLYFIDLATGIKTEVAKKLRVSANLSPEAKYIQWYSYPDSAFYAYSIETRKTHQLTDNKLSTFFDELNDRPMHPYPYGMAGWTKGDKAILIYDRYDIWKIDLANIDNPKRLTNGRENGITYRYVRLDREQRFIDPNEPLILHQFDNKTKASGYVSLSLNSGQLKSLVKDDYNFTRRIYKAKDADALVFTKENFKVFPNLEYTNLNFQNPRKISDANPQQAQYKWGDVELYNWTSIDGQQLQGLLVKPDNFDPKKKYPMIVNFYERSTDGLHRHRAPYPHRSTINYSFYTSRGYVIFNPDIPYRVGYPGESAFNSVVSGTTALLNEGFIDRDRVALQGHSWGGYQIAHIVTKTDLFKCAESGAPVVNMISAYGGIRWGSGMSRMFQYEHTQSRLGGTLWEMPMRYVENSPIFWIDKINTPLLILHNDEDTAVPWYQGIEFFVALRRLGKPAWLLNYNGEPHWPVKLQNRKDFNIRMQQFFDYYLKDAPKPVWMEKGVPAMYKGIEQGLQLMKK